ncbi:hypothetical protein C2E23DRAFT_849866 [Lenzites betulinus]|nr:hypothetical protein C2E23DRAFT_849866 [Lenzites betulinus]
MGYAHTSRRLYTGRTSTNQDSLEQHQMSAELCRGLSRPQSHVIIWVAPDFAAYWP